MRPLLLMRHCRTMYEMCCTILVSEAQMRIIALMLGGTALRLLHAAHQFLRWPLPEQHLLFKSADMVLKAPSGHLTGNNKPPVGAASFAVKPTGPRKNATGQVRIRKLLSKGGSCHLISALSMLLKV